MRRFVSLAIIVAGLGGVLTTAASGSRPATEQETASLASAVGLPPSCIAATISTADESWAGVTETNAAGCSPGNGIVVLQLENGTWTQVTAGSDFGTCPVSKVPTPVAKDLGLCRDPRTIILCANKNASFRLSRVAPSRCDTLGPQQSFNEGANLAGLRWRGWGHTVATATGVGSATTCPLRTSLSTCGPTAYAANAATATTSTHACRSARSTASRWCASRSAEASSAGRDPMDATKSSEGHESPPDQRRCRAHSKRSGERCCRAISDPQRAPCGHARRRSARATKYAQERGHPLCVSLVGRLPHCAHAHR